MTKARIPNPLERRHLIERDLSEAQALRVAEAYIEQGRAVEALEFLHKAGAEDRLAVLRADAVQAGDAFLLRQVATVSGVPAERDEWREVARAAQGAGKERYAEQATRQAERGED